MISIIIPLYNKEQYISRAIQSVLDQTFQEFEIVIVNDGSTDGSVSAVKKFSDERIRLIHQENAGVSAARNRGVREAKYDLIAFLDADDEWLPEHLKEILRLKQNFPKCQVFATNYKIIDPEGKEQLPVNVDMLGLEKEQGILQNYFEAATKTAPPLWTSAIAVNKKALEVVGGFPVGVKSGEDLLTWAKLAVSYDIAYIAQCSSVYHIEIENWEPGRATDKIDYVGKELKKLLYEMKGEDKASLRKYLGLWHKMRASTFLRHRQRSLAVKEILVSLYYNPYNYKSYLYLSLVFMPYAIIKKAFG